jgi:hypothetical protein
MGTEKVCPLCRTAARASKAGTESDDTEDLDIAQLQKTGGISITEAGMPLVYIPPGEFLMGFNKGGENEKPAHFVYLDAYYVGRFPVTNWQYHEFVTTPLTSASGSAARRRKTTPCLLKRSGKRRPAAPKEHATPGETTSRFQRKPTTKKGFRPVPLRKSPPTPPGHPRSTARICPAILGNG